MLERFPWLVWSLIGCWAGLFFWLLWLKRQNARIAKEIEDRRFFNARQMLLRKHSTEQKKS